MARAKFQNVTTELLDSARCNTGEVFHLSSFMTVTASAVYDMIIETTSTVQAHVKISVDCQGAGYVKLYESPVFASSGAFWTTTATAAPRVFPVCTNRTLAGSATTKFFVKTDPAWDTAGADTIGTEILSMFAGGNTQYPVRIGGEAREGIEWILSATKDYALRFKDLSAATNTVSIVIEFWEET